MQRHSGIWMPTPTTAFFLCLCFFAGGGDWLFGSYSARLVLGRGANVVAVDCADLDIPKRVQAKVDEKRMQKQTKKIYEACACVLVQEPLGDARKLFRSMYFGENSTLYRFLSQIKDFKMWRNYPLSKFRGSRREAAGGMQNTAKLAAPTKAIEEEK